MTAREFAALALKLMGITAIVCALPKLDGVAIFIGMIAGGQVNISDTLLLAGATLTPGLLAVAGILLLTFSNPLAARLVDDHRELTLPHAMSGQDLQAILFAVAGVLVFLLAIPRLIVASQTIFVIDDPYEPTFRPAGISLYSLIGLAIQIALAVWLFFGARGLANFWHRLRNAGLEEKLGEKPTPTGE